MAEYHLWNRPGGLNLRGVGWKAASFVAVAYFVGLVVVQAHVRAGAAILLGALAVTGLAGARVGGVTLTRALADALRWRLADRRFDAVAWRRPAALSSLALLRVTSAAVPFAVVHDRRAQRASVTLEVTSTAAELSDAGQRDADVARFERWLESLGHHDVLAQVTVTVAMGPETGERLRAAVREETTSLAPMDCRRLLDALAASLPEGAVTTRTYVTLTLDLRALQPDWGRRDLATVAPVLDAAVSAISSGLDGCGVSEVRRLDAAELAAVVRAAYDPSAEAHLEAALMNPAVWSAVPEFELAGPVHAVEHRDRYEHDGSSSVTYVWAAAPRVAVASSELAPLFAPGSFRKRVTCVYVPTASGRTMDAATELVRRRRFAQALTRLPIVGRPATAQDDRDADDALAAASDIAAGAGWVAMTVLATVTASASSLDAATAELERAAGSSQLRLRRLYGQQAAGFAAGLPTGLLLGEVTARWVR